MGHDQNPEAALLKERLELLGDGQLEIQGYLFVPDLKGFRTGRRDRSELHLEPDCVDEQLVFDKLVADQERIALALDQIYLRIHDKRPFLGKAVQTFGAACAGAEKESLQESGANQLQEPGVGAGSGMESSNLFGHLAVNQSAHGNFLK